MMLITMLRIWQNLDVFTQNSDNKIFLHHMIESNICAPVFLNVKSDKMLGKLNILLLFPQLV